MAGLVLILKPRIFKSGVRETEARSQPSRPAGPSLSTPECTRSRDHRLAIAICPSIHRKRQNCPRERPAFGFRRGETRAYEDTKMTTDTLLTSTEVWNAKIYTNGWKKPGLGTAEVTEKATGAKLGEIGIASAKDVSAAAAAARQAQKDCANVPGPKRGDVLRNFSRLLLSHSEEIADQIVQETGAIRAKAQMEVQLTARDSLEAAALGSQPQGIQRRSSRVVSSL
jgi:hypothetical protein